MNDQPGVAIFDADSPPALAFLQSLARRGVPVTVYSHRRWNVARCSRHAAEFHRCPDPADRPAFKGWLEAELQADRIARVAPTSGLIAFHCAELRERFAPEVRGTIPTVDELLACLDKLRFADVCRELGLPTPRTRAPSGLEQAQAMALELGYPVMIKPRSHLGVGARERDGVARSPQDLTRLFRRYPLRAGDEDLRTHMPGLEWPLLQEYFASAEVRVYCLTGFRDAACGVIALMTSCRLEAFPPDHGVSCLQETAELPERLARDAQRLVEATQRVGIFGLEFLRSAEGYQAIDLDPHGFGFIGLNIAAGHDLPWLWYQASLGHPLSAPASAALGLRWRWGLPLRLRCYLELLCGPDRLAALRRMWQLLFKPAVSAGGTWSDPLPRLLAWLRPWRRPQALFRPLLREQLARRQTVRPDETSSR